MKRGRASQSACVPPEVGQCSIFRSSLNRADAAVWSQEIPLEKVHNLADLDGKTMKQELNRIGYLGEIKCSYESTPLSAHL